MGKLTEYARVIAEALRSRGKTVGFKNNENTDFTLNIAKDLDSILIGSIRDRQAYCHAKGEGSRITLIEHRDKECTIELADPNGFNLLVDAILATTEQGRRIGKLWMGGDAPITINHGVGKQPPLDSDAWLVGHHHNPNS